MKLSSKLKIGFACSVGLVCRLMLAHDVPVHKAITASAANAEYENSLAFNDFVNIISLDRSFKSATNSMIDGSGHEDDPPGTTPDPADRGGYRSLNHFYDPVHSNYGRGLSDSPFLAVLGGDSRELLGTNSFAWASISNCVGVKTRLYSQYPINTYSWQNARYSEWLGLTSTNQLSRQTNLDNMFRAIGQVMHLLEDTSQPQHVRNEQHLDTFAGIVYTPWRSPIEDYGLYNYKQNPQWFAMPPNAIIGWANWQAAGFTKLEDFWDRHLYNGDGGKLSAAENGGAQLGLAEWCNGNFLGDRHEYADYFATNDIRYYPYPRRSGTITQSIDNLTFRNGHVVQHYYLDKNADGVSVTHHSALTLWGAEHPTIIKARSTTIKDDNVLKDYHSIFIPKAVEYCAGLIDYFFRGTFNASIVNVDTNVPEFTVSFLNTSSQDFSNGTFYIFQSNSSGVRSLVAQTNLLGLLPNGILTTNSSVTATFLSLPPTNVPIFLYQGTIGISNGVPQDPVDAGIAIAVAPIQVLVTANPLWTDSGFAVSAGQTMTITASGTWDGGQGPVTGDGLEDGSTDLFLGGVNHDTLIAYVGTNPPYEDSLGNNRWGDNTYFPQSAGNGYWLVGTNAQITTDRGGELWFLFNDDAVTKAVSDNSGALTVQISVKGN